MERITQSQEELASMVNSPRGIWLRDDAENSIMQTITIAVSAILIAAGLVTAPGLINNARDNNATNDLSNIAYSEEGYLGDTGTYTADISSTTSQDSLNGHTTENGTRIKYTMSDKVVNSAVVCTGKVQGYLLKSVSSSTHVFYRSSESSATSSNIADITIPSCLSAADLASIGILPSAPSVPGSALLPQTAFASSVGGTSGSELLTNGSYEVGQKIKSYGLTSGYDYVQDGLGNVSTYDNDSDDLSVPAQNLSSITVFDGGVQVAKFDSIVQLAYATGTGDNSGKSWGQFALNMPAIHDIATWSKIYSGTAEMHVRFQGKDVVLPIYQPSGDMSRFDSTGYTNNGANLSISDTKSEIFKDPQSSGQSIVIGLNPDDIKGTNADFYLNKVNASDSTFSPLLRATVSYKASGDSAYSDVGTIYGKLSKNGVYSDGTSAGPLSFSNYNVYQTLQLPDNDYSAGTWKVTFNYEGSDYSITGSIAVK
jgi:hypothetical protein